MKISVFLVRFDIMSKLFRFNIQLICFFDNMIQYQTLQLISLLKFENIQLFDDLFNLLFCLINQRFNQFKYRKIETWWKSKKRKIFTNSVKMTKNEKIFCIKRKNLIIIWDHYERRLFSQLSLNDANSEKIFELRKFLLKALVRNLIRTSSSQSQNQRKRARRNDE
jgi:hypothetical protein